jgi:formyl-CoA transferase
MRMRIGETVHPERAGWGKPLDGVRVLAAEQMQALPYATQLMARLGADVVKVEHPRTGESGRGARPSVVDDDGREVGATYLRNNLGKRSVGIDLKHPAGRDLFLALCAHVDVVAENFTPGTMDRLGLGYDAVAERNPRAVYVSVSGFGNAPGSPYRTWPAYAPIPEAMAGFYEMNRAGDERPEPLVAGALGDIGTALYAVVGTLAALRHRERTGLGQHLDVAMYDAMVAMADLVPFMWSMGAAPFRAGGGGQGIIAGYRAVDGWFVVEVVREHQFARLAEVVGHPEWIADERFATRAGWDDHEEAVIRPAIEAWAATRTKLEACRELCDAGVAAGPSNTPADLRADPHVAQRHMLVEVPRPDGGAPLLVVGNPVKLSRVAEGPETRFPQLGQHTDEVLKELLRLEPHDIARLREEGVI